MTITLTQSPGRVPLVPVAMMVGLGIYLERTAPLPAEMLVALLIGVSAAWLFATRQRLRSSVLLLWLFAGLLAAAWHRVNLAWPPDAMGYFATADRTLVRLRGSMAEDVNVQLPRRPDLRSTVSSTRSTFLLDTHQLHTAGGWQRVSGRVRVTVEGEVRHLAVGDGVEVFGALIALTPPVNPGGLDLRQRWLDQHIQASLYLKSTDAITLHAESTSWSVALLMGRARAWVRQTLAAWLPPAQAGLAQALLCGEQTALQPDQFEGYLQTGVYHVLAVSGQHLVVLCAFVGFALRFTGKSMRSRAAWLALFVILYTLLTGARAPVVRAAVIVLAWCGALALRRTAQPVNSLALAWLVVAILNPTDMAHPGCLLSFIAVLVLMGNIRPWYHRECEQLSPLDRLEDRFRPLTLRIVYWVALQGKWGYFAALAVWLATAPLVADRFHLVSPVAVVLGPLLGVVISLALLSGVMLMLVSWAPLLAEPVAKLLGYCLTASDTLVEVGRAIPFGHGYWPDLPAWWVHAFYFVLVPWLLMPWWWHTWKPLLLAILAWFALGVLITRPDVPQGLRVTVLSVGHGAAIVLETPDGRCLLYDAGSLAGPEVAQRHIASYLWYRRRTRIDEVFISHADLDHFNALPDLSGRFRIGQVRLTPSFEQKSEPGTQATLHALKQRGVPVQLLTKGDQLQAGDLTLVVLHPPTEGPPGPENVRSLVLLVSYRGHRLLLTGDLEQAGLEQMLREPMTPVDVLVAPHHGSRVSNTDRFARWCQPRLVVSSETFPRTAKPDPYAAVGGVLWRTWVHGGVTIEFTDQIQAQTYLTRQRWHSAGR